MVKTADDNPKNNKCGSNNSLIDGTNGCPVPNPQEWPPVMQIPAPQFRASSNGFDQFADLPNESCKLNGSCPVTVFITGNNQAEWISNLLGGNMFMSPEFMNSTDDDAYNLAYLVLGSESMLSTSYFYDSAFFSDFPIYYVQKKCLPNSTLDLSNSLQQLNISEGQEVRCIEGLPLWRNSSSAVNDELFKGYYQKKKPKGNINDILAANDFLNSSGNYFTVSIWFNSTYKFNDDSTGGDESNLLRVPRSVNLASNAYLQFLKGSGTKVLFDFVKEMPKLSSTDTNMIDISSFLNSLFFTWILLLLFRVILTSLVYDKEKKLRIMMKMHGLGDAAYWTISYAYFLFISLIYMLSLMLFGSVLGLVFFRMNDYTIQFVFYFVYANLQISLAFLVAAFSSNVKTASDVYIYIYIYGTRACRRVSVQIFQRRFNILKRWYNCFGVVSWILSYRGIYELSQYGTRGIHIGTGMNWRDFNDGVNGMKEVLFIMLIKWLVVLLVAYYAKKVQSSGSGRNPLIFLNKLWKKSQRRGPNTSFLMDMPDVIQERENVDQFLLHPDASYSIICDNLKKVYPGKDGNPPKFAVRGLSLALPPGECFGSLDPNGARKTSFLSMVSLFK
ncbi:hypothetical protein FEM48_Zijuj05G0020700 [Ziziphus jujuba var. spinosa]|uniref:ABC-2 type transporter transmembrane domain-containing protein n=1 Tax=Ziziphus jujuba var. spinosa TaxID=714518 RepID=A0A978VC64_ZIZJJ|nr:hypothetical protein FEM48_Zijuj05G0020700 [Ziziphus jujuba var. spinosa]